MLSQTRYPNVTILLGISILLERIAFYGSRAVLVFFLMDPVGMGLSQTDTLSIYQAFTMGIFVLALPLGFLSDLTRQNEWGLIVGGILSAIAYSLLAWVGGSTTYLALILLVLGSDLLRVNLLALFSSQFPRAGRKRDGALYLYYFVVNLGAMIGTGLLAITELFYLQSFSFAFQAAAIASFLLLGAVFVLKFVYKLSRTPVHPEDEGQFDTAAAPLLSRLLVAFALTCLTALFWGSYELIGDSIYAYFTGPDSPYTQLLGSPMYAFLLFPSAVVMLFCGVLGIIWLSSPRKKNTANLLAIGLAGFAVSFGLSYFMVQPVEMGSILSLAGLYLTFQVVGELLFVPLALSWFTRLVPPRYLATAIGAYFLILGLGTFVFHGLSGLGQSPEINILFGVLWALVGVGLLVGLRPYLKEWTGGLD